MILLIVGVKDPDLSITKQEWVEAYISREILTKEESNQLIKNMYSQTGLNNKLLKERFYNLKKQRLTDTLRGRLT